MLMVVGIKWPILSVMSEVEQPAFLPLKMYQIPIYPMDITMTGYSLECRTQKGKDGSKKDPWGKTSGGQDSKRKWKDSHPKGLFSTNSSKTTS